MRGINHGMWYVFPSESAATALQLSRHSKYLGLIGESERVYTGDSR